MPQITTCQVTLCWEQHLPIHLTIILILIIIIIKLRHAETCFPEIPPNSADFLLPSADLGSSGRRNMFTCTLDQIAGRQILAEACFPIASLRYIYIFFSLGAPYSFPLPEFHLCSPCHWTFGGSVPTIKTIGFIFHRTVCPRMVLRFGFSPFFQWVPFFHHRSVCPSMVILRFGVFCPSFNGGKEP